MEKIKIKKIKKKTWKKEVERRELRGEKKGGPVVSIHGT